MAQLRSIQRAQAVGRVLWKLGNRHPGMRGSVAAARSMGRAAARASRILLLEITGFFFAVFACLGLAAAWRQWTRLQSGQSSSPAHVVVALLFSAVFLYFSGSSFWRASRESTAAKRE